jgi:protein-tyrosine phosphatase
MRKPVKTPPLPFPHSYWVLPGRLLAGEHPGGKDQAETQHRVDCLTIAGITFYLDLTEPDECPTYRHLLPRKAKYVRSAIADMEVPDSVTQMQLIQTRIAAALTIGHGVYVHCQAGIGRTGTAMGCFLVEQGLGGAAALKQLNKLWRRSVRAQTWPNVPQTSWQAEYIQKWPQHRKFHNRTRVG